jgi:hypothetical protein
VLSEKREGGGGGQVRLRSQWACGRIEEREGHGIEGRADRWGRHTSDRVEKKKEKGRDGPLRGKGEADWAGGPAGKKKRGRAGGLKGEG